MKQNLLKNEALLISNKILNSSLHRHPTKHIIIDNAFSQYFIDKAYKNFKENNINWEINNDENIEIKLRSKWNSEFDIPDGMVEIVRILNSSNFLHSVSAIFRINQIIPDPYFTGGGLNLIKRNGLLAVHVDGNYHKKMNLNRRLNAILFFNKNWKDMWNGDFCFYDRKGERLEKKISPIYNRLFIFETHDYSYHGHPTPLMCPNNKSRKSLILYYYTSKRTDSNNIDIKKPHRALWKNLNKKDKDGKQSL